MDAFDPKNEMMDRYLKGELHGKALDDFLHELDSDPSMKKEIEFRLLLVRGIQERGATELKAFIRQRVSQKRGLFVGYRTWYMAAAAVAVILVGSVVVFRNLSDHRATLADKAKTETSIGPKQDDFIQKTQADTTLSGSGTIALNDKPEPIGSVRNPASEGDKAIDFAEMSPEQTGAGTVTMSDNLSQTQSQIPIASDIPVFVIRIDSPLERSAKAGAGTFKPVTAESTYRKKQKMKDSGFSDDDAKIALQGAENATSNTYKLNFFNTQDAKPKVSAIKQGNAEPEILVYNLPYDNPLLFYYNNRTYLRTASKYYEIDINKKGLQDVAAVTDQAIIKALNQQ